MRTRKYRFQIVEIILNICGELRKYYFEIIHYNMPEFVHIIMRERGQKIPEEFRFWWDNRLTTFGWDINDPSLHPRLLTLSDAFIFLLNRKSFWTGNVSQTMKRLRVGGKLASGGGVCAQT